MSVTVKTEIYLVCIDCGKTLHFIEEHPEWEEYTRIRVQSCGCSAAVAERDARIKESDDRGDRLEGMLDRLAQHCADIESTLFIEREDRDAAIARAVAEEREACAAKCHDISSKDSIWRYEVRAGAEMCESAIRARGEREE